MGILLAVLAVIPMGAATVSDAIDLSERFSIGQIGGLVVFAALLVTIYLFAVKDQKKSK